MKLFRKTFDELIVLQDYTFAGGSGRPIYNYYRHKLTSPGASVALVRLLTRNSYLKLFYLSLRSRRVVVNGLVCFRYWPVFLLCYLKKDLVIYLHEAAPHVEPYAKKHPLKFKLFLRLLKKRKVAFVSEWQRQYFIKLTPVPRFKIIYNNINFPYSKENGNRITIGMIGYQSNYKNVSFFSRVADAAAGSGLPYQFVWVGGKGGDMKGMYHSDKVVWLGDQEQVMDILNSIDVLLFTSYGDTFGLVITEALAKGKRIVSYIENGLTPFIKELKGCRIYDRFDEALVLRLLHDVLQENVDPEAHKELCRYLCSMENFEKRLNELFSAPL